MQETKSTSPNVLTALFRNPCFIEKAAGKSLHSGIEGVNGCLCKASNSEEKRGLG